MDHLKSTSTGVDTTDTPEQQAARVPEGAVLASHRGVSRVRAYIMGALMAVTPVIGSCGGDFENDDSFVEAGDSTDEPGQNPEQLTLKDRQVAVSCNKGGNWRFQGNYPMNFSIVVNVDGQPVASQNVVVDHNVDPSVLKQFYVEGPVANPKAKNVTVEAFDHDGKMIPIESSTQTKGMYGVPNCPVGLE